MLKNFYEDKNVLVDIGLDIFINEDGKEIGRVKKQGIKSNEDTIDSKQVADLSLQIAVDNNTLEIGKVIKLTFVATNNGPESATRVKVEDVLPKGYSFKCFETDKGTWEAPFWDIGDLANGEKATLLIEATVAEGEYNNSAKIEGYQQDNTPSNDTSSLINRLFLIKTIKTKFDSGAPSAGITNQLQKETEQFIITNNDKTEIFTSDCIAYKNSVEIALKESTRKEMVKIIQQDDGTGGSYTNKPQNNREYGGSISKNGVVKESPKGEVNDGTKNNASISIEYKNGQSIFHSHPSGTVDEEEKNNTNSGTSVQGIGTVKTSRHIDHAPSNDFLDGSIRKGDIYVAKNDGVDSETIKYVFARKKPQMVYIYNSKGILATLPQEYFITFKK